MMNLASLILVTMILSMSPALETSRRSSRSQPVVSFTVGLTTSLTLVIVIGLRNRVSKRHRGRTPPVHAAYAACGEYADIRRMSRGE